MNQFIVLCQIISIIVLIFLIYQFFTPNPEPFISQYMYLSKPTKCFSCEKQYKQPGKRRMGQSTKCFSCERELANKYGVEAGALGGSTKCFSCMNQFR